jgi:hypothetical protein
MKRISRSAPGWAAGLALTTLVGLGVALTSAVQAQQKAQDTVPFKIVIASKTLEADTYVVPFDPPLTVFKSTGTGSNSLIGQVTYIEHGFQQLAPDGNPVWGDAFGAMSGANGDAVFFAYKGAILGDPYRAGFVITGGKGRFKGASGNGIMTFSPGATVEDGLCSYEGVIAAPKP